MLFNPATWLKENKALQIKPISVIQYITYFFLGVYGGFVHVGIGYFYLGMLVLVGGYDIMKANVFKIVFVMCSVPFSLAVFAAQGNIVWSAGLIHAIGNIIGATIGVNYTVKKGGNFVRYIMLTLILLVALQLLGVLSAEKILSILK